MIRWNFAEKLTPSILRRFLGMLDSITRPVDPETREFLDRRWETLPEHIKTDAQVLGRHAVGCEGTHGVFPKCNFSCTPCYHSREANQVRTDGKHSVREIAQQMSFLRKVRGPHAHAQLIGGEVSLLDPDDHAEAILEMRAQGREPMSFTHGDFDYEYLEKLVVDKSGRTRLKRISFAGHFDTTMRGRRGIRTTADERQLNSHRQVFAQMFARLKKEHGTRYYLAHNMTVTPANVAQIPDVIRDNRKAGYNMFSFQPAAYVGNEKRWREDFRSIGADEVWELMEAGAGSKLVYQMIQTGDERCNRTAFGFYLGDNWFPVFEPSEPKDHVARDAFYRYLGGVYFNAPIWLLTIRFGRVAITNPIVIRFGLSWLFRTIKRVGGPGALIGKKIVPMTFVMHRFMDAADVKVAWDLMGKGIQSTDPRIKETQERLASCFYAMAHPETNEVVPACVQHSVLDPAENVVLSQLLPLPKRRRQEPEVEANGAR